MRTWSVDRQEPISESLSPTSSIQSLHVHALDNEHTRRTDYLLSGTSMNERTLVIFESMPSTHDLSNAVAVC